MFGKVSEAQRTSANVRATAVFSDLGSTYAYLQTLHCALECENLLYNVLLYKTKLYNVLLYNDFWLYNVLLYNDLEPNLLLIFTFLINFTE